MHERTLAPVVFSFVAASLALAALGCDASSKEAKPEAPSSTTHAAAPSTTQGAQPSAPGALPPDACSIASAAEIQAALGVSFGSPRSNPGGAAKTVSVCSYEGASGVLMLRTEIIDRAGYDKTLQTLKGGEKVSGVGDDAYFQFTPVGPMGAGTFLVYKGKTLLAITYTTMDLTAAKALPAEKKLATTLLGRL